MKEKEFLNQMNSALSHAESKINTLIVIDTFMLIFITTLIIGLDANYLYFIFLISPGISFLILLFAIFSKGIYSKKKDNILNPNNWNNYEYYEIEKLNISENEFKKEALKSSYKIAKLVNRKYKIVNIAIVFLFPVFVIYLIYEIIENN